MSIILRYLEYGLARLLYNRRAYDAQLLTKHRAFEKHPDPTIPISSPDCGPSGAVFRREYSKFGGGRFPTLEWEVGPGAGALDVKEYLLCCEDPDAPLGHPNVHGIYAFIPPTVTRAGPEDLEVVREEEGGVKVIRAGWRVGKNRRNVVYIPPRPPLGHGPHRYLFELVALSSPLEREKVPAVPRKEEIAELLVGKVAGWGLWTATYEQEW